MKGVEKLLTELPEEKIEIRMYPIGGGDGRAIGRETDITNIDPRQGAQKSSVYERTLL